MTTRTRKRILAVLIGLVPALAYASLWYWIESYVNGREECTRCRWERTVDRRGPFWSASEPTAPEVGRPDSSLIACASHQWRRRGCWAMDGGVRCYR